MCRRDIDYGETFSFTVRLTSVRVLLQNAVNNDLKLSQSDIKSAYLNAPRLSYLFGTT